jgi:hypothetical protein
VSFAVTALNEASLEPYMEDYSEEALIRGAVSGGDATAFARFPAVTSQLESVGQPLEDAWPYGVATPTNPGAAKRACTTHQVLPTPDSIRQALDLGLVVAVGMRINRSFHRLRGDTVEDPGDVVEAGRHAVAIVAYDLSGGLRFLARNSWGVGWGLDGHAWIPERYMAMRTETAWCEQKGG